jgi:hypothetical protein
MQGITLHWSAGTYNQIFDGYAYCVVFNPKNGNVWIVKTLRATEKGYHLWGRNSGHMGVSFMAMRGASPDGHTGQYPIPDVMAQAAWAFVAEMCIDLKHKPDDMIAHAKKASNATQIWTVPGEIQMPFVADHRAFARKDGYPAARFDIGDFFPDWHNKILWYYGKFMTGDKPRLFKNELADLKPLAA